jgi:hypothetical protein
LGAHRGHARQVDRDVQHRAPSGKSIPRKKMSLQALCVRSMRTGRALSERIGKARRGALQQFRADAQRLIRRMADAEHPLIAAHERTLRRTWLASVCEGES